MNLKHLIQGYNFNKIPARIQEEINTPEEQAGVINYNENTNASYLLDEEGMIKTICLFSNCIATNCKSIKEQLEHVTQTLIIIQKTIEILGNTKKEEANSI